MIGDVTVYPRIEVKTCARCGHRVIEGGRCDYRCVCDGDARPAGSTIIQVVKRTDEVIEERTV